MKHWAVILTILICSAAFAAPAGAQMNEERGPGPGPGMRGESAKEMTAEQFDAVKEKVLKMFERRQKRLDGEKACVEAATNMEEMRKCRPEPRRQMRPGRRQRLPEGADRERPRGEGMDGEQ